MEQKKILWIVAALGIFLLVIFLGTLIIYSPQETITTTSATEIINDTWINPQAINAPETQVLPNNGLETETSPQSVDPNQTLQDASVHSGDLTVISQGQTTVYAQDGLTTIDLTNTQVAAASEKTEPSVRPIATRVPSSNTTAKPVVQDEKEPAVTPTPKAEAPKATTPVAPKAPVNQYWVQAASYVSKPNAENARSALVQQKLPAEVFTHSDKEGVTYYRVRVGPYTTKSEAEYWNTLIQTVDTFADSKSYVTNTAQPAQ